MTRKCELKKRAQQIIDSMLSFTEFRHRMAMKQIWKGLRPAEVPETFEMPPAPTVRVKARVRNIEPAPFVFVDE